MLTNIKDANKEALAIRKQTADEAKADAQFALSMKKEDRAAAIAERDYQLKRAQFEQDN
jgi:hypothetical protein